MGPVIVIQDEELNGLLEQMQSAVSGNTNSQRSDIFDVSSDENEAGKTAVSYDLPFNDL